MDYLHYDMQLDSDELVEVDLDKQANIRLLDPANFSHYRRGQRYTYYGGLAKLAPFTLKPPHPGRWHLVIDLGRYPGRVSANVRKLKDVN
jgi:hypothetical protein